MAKWLAIALLTVTLTVLLVIRLPAEPPIEPTGIVNAAPSAWDISPAKVPIEVSYSPCPPNATQSDLMTVQAIQVAIAQARQAWITGDANAFAALFTADGELIVPGQRWQGQDAIRQVLSDFAASHTDVEIEIQRIIIDRAAADSHPADVHQAVVEWTWQDTETATGTQTQAEDAIVVDFVDGKISRWREYIDTKTPS